MTKFRYLLVYLVISLISVFNSYSQNRDIILDADTGNEMDDLYAIVQLLQDSSVNTIGLTSVHFNNI